ncbi:MAG: citrate synthase [Candidatus Eremiobacterota bacterium]
MSGLEGTIVAETALSRVDGQRGELILRGRLLEELAGKVSFEAVCGLLWEEPEGEVAQGLARARQVAFEQVSSHLAETDALGYPAALRLLLTHLRPDARVPEHHLAVGAVGVGLRAVLDRRAGLPPRLCEGSHAQAVLGKSDQPLRRALDCYLCSVADHGMNPSTFTARVIASTGAELFPALVGALSALEGPLHGGAPGPVLDMLDACAAHPEGPVGWVQAELAAGRRLMGFGHRIYRVRDPRAVVLKRAVSELQSQRIRLAEQTEEAALAALRRHKPDRPLETNVEFYTALLLEAVGFPREAFTAVFAAGRVAGWCAHVREQRQNGRLIRPAARYVGSLPPGSEAHSDTYVGG